MKCIIKFLLPISYLRSSMALMYNKDQSIFRHVEIEKVVGLFCKHEKKVYYHCEVNGLQVTPIKRAEGQVW